MSVIADLIRAGVDPDLIARVAEEIAEARAASAREAVRPPRTARQERNARYYAKASEKRLNASETLPPKKEIPPTPPKEKITPIPQSSLRSDCSALALKKSPNLSPREILETVLSPEMADGVIKHRSAMRKPLTAIAAEGLARGLRAVECPDDAARTMIERGWAGFKPEWLSNDRERSRAPPGGNPYMKIAAELGAFDLDRTHPSPATHDLRAADARSRHDYAALPQPVAMGSGGQGAFDQI